MENEPHIVAADHASPAPASAEQPEIDTGLSQKLHWYLQYFEEGFPAALRDAISFCNEHSLFQRGDLTEDVLQLVLKVRTYAERKEKPTRNRKPKGSPTRRRKGRPAVPQVHIERYKLVEAFLEAAPDKAGQEDVTAAAHAVGGRQWDAFRKSYWKVVHSNLHGGYYEPEYPNSAGETE